MTPNPWGLFPIFSLFRPIILEVAKVELRSPPARRGGWFRWESPPPQCLRHPAARKTGFTDEFAGLTDEVAGITDEFAGMTDEVAGITDEFAGMQKEP